MSRQTSPSAGRRDLDREWIESHIPHGGRMCLLEEVSSWDEVARQVSGDQPSPG